MLFLDDRRVAAAVDLALDRRPAVVGDVDGARQRDEPFAEIARLLAQADLVLDVPQLFVDRGEFGLERRQVGAVEPRLAELRREQRELAAHVGELVGIVDPPLLDLQDGDLVDQLADRAGDVDRPPGAA